MIIIRNVGPLAAAVFSLALLGCAGGEDKGPATEPVPTDLAVSPGATTQIKQLAGDELQTLFGGAEIHGVAPDGRRWAATFAEYGGAVIEWTHNGQSGQDVGSWRIVDNTNCIQWKTMMEGRENCITVYDVGDAQYNIFNDNGSLQALATVAR